MNSDHEVLERELRALAAEMDVPASRDLTAEVAAAVRRRQAQTPSRARARLRPGHAFAVMVLGIVVAVLAIPPARLAVADLLGVPGIALRFGDEAPVLVEGSGVRLGEPVTLATAQQHVPFDILLPDLEADLDRRGGGVYLDRTVPGGAVHIVFPVQDGLPPTRYKGAGALLTQFRGELEPVFLKKIVAEGTEVRRVRVNGSDGFWLAGAPHVLVRDGAGAGRLLEAQLAGNTLIWEERGITLRFETAQDLAAAVRLAATID